MNQLVPIISPWIRLRLRAVAVLGGILLLMVLTLIGVALALNYLIGLT